jgi:hypothetical protein
MERRLTMNPKTTIAAASGTASRPRFRWIATRPRETNDVCTKKRSTQEKKRAPWAWTTGPRSPNDAVARGAQ